MTLVVSARAGSPVTALARGVDPTACCAVPTDQFERAFDNRRSDHNAADVESAPNDVADYPGGIAARLRDGNGSLVPGHLYLTMATVGSDEPARLFEQTPFTHDHSPHADGIESNRLAVETAEAITGNIVEHLEFTTAPGGGPSGGLIYLIAYLNLISHGAFTAHVNVAATGHLRSEGYIGHIRGVDEKLGAVRLAGADVFFTPSAPSHQRIAELAERHAGHVFRSRFGRMTLASERGLEEYEGWGASAPDALDVVVVGHIADVAAYLCGAGSGYACSIADHLGGTTTSDILTEYDVARAAHKPSTGPSLGHPSLGSLQ